MFHDSKHGRDYYVENTLALAIKVANEITAKYYSEYAKHYKEVKNEGCYDEIIIKQLDTEKHLTKNDIQSILNLVVVNPHCLNTADNEINLTKYVHISFLMNKYNWQFIQGHASYSKSYLLVDEKQRPIKISSEYIKSVSPVLMHKKALNSVPDTHMRHVAKKIEYSNDVDKDLESFDHWLGQWIYEDFKIQVLPTEDGETVFLYT